MKAVPNIISIFRICLVPVFIYAYFADDHDIKYYALLIFIVAGLSDILDGYLARKYEAQSKLGKLLDPLGDKLMVFTVMVCITITRPILIWAVLVFFVKEVLMGIGGYLLHKKTGGEIPPANLIGKSSTILFYIVCAALMFFSNIPDSVAIALISAAILLALAALAGYLRTYIKLIKSNSKTAK
ncbi:MAG: CDP-alcohol phosphatidyltransferase family protein [Oscillospiraceae bacterium]|jgi:CDP-diacylglycerol--glycerol-3-phosphate 3-phosphatidyltransferase|nr:CDP-alcohol phosphatidyltransferase family protein [Oscillospiraceae bacterium]